MVAPSPNFALFSARRPRPARRQVRSEELIDNILVYPLGLHPCAIWRWARGATIPPAFDRPSHCAGPFAFRESRAMSAPASAADQSNAPAWVRHRALRQWVSELARLSKPERIHWCDGPRPEYERLCAGLGRAGPFLRLNE